MRFGNAFVFRGTFYLPGLAASSMYWRGITKLYIEKPDEVAAEKAFLRSAELDPTAYFVHIQLGNLYLKRADRQRALHAYRDALKCRERLPNPRRASGTHSTGVHGKLGRCDAFA